MPRDRETRRGSTDQSTPGGRPLAVRVRSARRRKPSSTEWLNRQLNDPYVAEAHRLGYRSRAAFKLIQLDERFHLLKPGMRVVDLGCAPGGWTQIAARRLGAQGRVIGVDLSATEPIEGAALLTGDFRDADIAEHVHELLGGPADLVLSDMAAPATGHAATDHLRIVALAEEAFAFAESILKPGGAFVAKVFQGGAEGSLLAALKRAFAEVRHAKPAASRAESAETYVVARGFRGAA
ncbi:MAG TPA: RlmE family RNA methyltransferase [Stellaceae bacterium]|jgi:23S rRNA (uridine2552-2'-O)-methyltransferase|nr:RlmE family RNA methyltransferase [Stellaceae bacterium]